MLYSKSKNRHVLYIGILLIVLIIIPAIVFAKGSMSKKPVGGKVIADKKALAPAVVCSGVQGPFSIKAFNNAPSGPVRYYVSDLNTNDSKINAYLIGLYDTVQDMESCKNPTTGAPVPVYRSYPFGNTSR